MRVIAGQYKGRKLEYPKGPRTHPMGERVKSALFNTIQAEIPGARVLDAFGGSGALGIEALSRGASFVQVIERDFRAFKVIEQNFANIGAPHDTYGMKKGDCATWAKKNPKEIFDVILLDPPYDELNLSTVRILVDLLPDNGLMVLSHSGREAVPTVTDKVVVVDDRIYAGAALSYYRKVED